MCGYSKKKKKSRQYLSVSSRKFKSTPSTMRQPLLSQEVKSPSGLFTKEVRNRCTPTSRDTVYSRLTSAPNSSSQCFKKSLRSVSFYRHTYTNANKCSFSTHLLSTSCILHPEAESRPSWSSWSGYSQDLGLGIQGPLSCPT